MKKMEQTNMKEREISIVDLMVDILLHWRAFIIWMLIGAVALGAFSSVRSVNAVNQQEAPAETHTFLKKPTGMNCLFCRWILRRYARRKRRLLLMVENAREVMI